VLVASAAGARRGLLLRGGDVLEAAAMADAVVLDKTGTLTQGRLQLTSASAYGLSTASCDSVPEPSLPHFLHCKQSCKQWPGRQIQLGVFERCLDLSSTRRGREDVRCILKLQKQHSSRYQGSRRQSTAVTCHTLSSSIAVQLAVGLRVQVTPQMMKSFRLQRLWRARRGIRWQMPSCQLPGLEV
jgi:magnesium-transporting ATPase (P-type)